MHIFKLHFPGFNRFNRYMVECKYISLNSVHIIRLCFNRYMVECKFYLINDFLCKRCVLIDTWWNVNLCVLCVVMIFIQVLIDTWWNVNEIVGVDHGYRNSFNRYMVECK